MASLLLTDDNKVRFIVFTECSPMPSDDISTLESFAYNSFKYILLEVMID